MSQLSTHCFCAPNSPFSSCSAQIDRPRRAFLIYVARDISLVSRGHCRRKEGSLPGSGFRLLLFLFLLYRLLVGQVRRDSWRCPPPAAHRQSLKACGRAQASDPFPWPSGGGAKQPRFLLTVVSQTLSVCLSNSPAPWISFLFFFFKPSKLQLYLLQGDLNPSLDKGHPPSSATLS